MSELNLEFGTALVYESISLNTPQGVCVDVELHGHSWAESCLVGLNL